MELTPEDGAYLLPYLGRLADPSASGVPFEDADLVNMAIQCGGRQFFYPDASRIFEEIDRTITGRDDHGEANSLDRRADYDFIRVLPAAGYTKQGERSGVDYYHYKPYPIARTPGVESLAKAANMVQQAMASGGYAGGIWMEGSPTVEETTYWLSLLIDTELPFASIASQRTHGQLSNDGDRNIVDAVDYVLSGEGAVGVLDEQIFAARELKKADDRPGNYKATGGHGRPRGHPRFCGAAGDDLVQAGVQAHSYVGGAVERAAGGGGVSGPGGGHQPVQGADQRQGRLAAEHCDPQGAYCEDGGIHGLRP